MRASSELGRESSAVRVDVRDWGSVRSSAEEVRSRTERVNVAVNVPGVNRRKPVLALEFAPHNIQVNALAPAYFATPLVRQVMEDRDRNRTARRWRLDDGIGRLIAGGR